VLSRKFREKGVEIVSINVHDPLKNIGIFKNKNKPEYPILTDGEPTAIGYGVSAYPTFVVVDKDGKVVYSKPGLFEEELETALTGSL
jgi:thioredoxin-related protein